MVSLRPKEGGSFIPPVPPQRANTVLIVLLVITLIAVGAVAYGQFSGRTALESRIATLEGNLQEQVVKLQQSTTSLASDLDVVTKRIGVTDQELASARKFAERLRVEQEQAKQQLATELATKASATEVSNVAEKVDAAREETATKVAEVQKAADTKITSATAIPSLKEGD